MENLICYAEACKFNHAKACSAKEITIVTHDCEGDACTTDDTACKQFELKN